MIKQMIKNSELNFNNLFALSFLMNHNFLNQFRIYSLPRPCKLHNKQTLFFHNTNCPIKRPIIPPPLPPPSISQLSSANLLTSTYNTLV